MKSMGILNVKSLDSKSRPKPAIILARLISANLLNKVKP